MAGATPGKGSIPRLRRFDPSGSASPRVSVAWCRGPGAGLKGPTGRIPRLQPGNLGDCATSHRRRRGMMPASTEIPGTCNLCQGTVPGNRTRRHLLRCIEANTGRSPSRDPGRRDRRRTATTPLTNSLSTWQLAEGPGSGREGQFQFGDTEINQQGGGSTRNWRSGRTRTWWVRSPPAVWVRTPSALTPSPIARSRTPPREPHAGLPGPGCEPIRDKDGAGAACYGWMSWPSREGRPSPGAPA